MAQEKKTILDGLNLVDKFLFDAAISEKEVFEAIASIVTEETIVLKEVPHVEKEEGISPELRAIRLDVLGVTEEETYMLLEMQKKNTYNIVKRSRYYQGLTDVSLLSPGEKDFNKLRDVCLVFISPFDIFGRGLCRYTFEGVCRECPDLKLKDGALRIFINTKGRNREEFSQEFQDFCDYAMDSSDAVAQRSRSERIKRIHSCVKEIRATEKMGVSAMQRWEEIEYAKDEGRAEGRAEGRELGLRSLIRTVKAFCSDFETLYRVVINNEGYEDITREHVMKYYN